MNILFLMLAGGVGALLRFVADGLIRTKLGRKFPWGTLIINASGALLLGILTGLMLYRHGFSTTKLILGTGFCGGYTTFSTASFETVRLIEEQRYKTAAFSAISTMLLTLFAAILGMWVVQIV